MMDSIKHTVSTARAVAEGIHKKKRGQSLIQGLLALMVITIIGVAVTYPVVVDIVNNSTASGTQQTILNILPLLVLVVLVIAFVGVMGLQTGR
ncbi:hypothetical protein LCGC14_0484760 [marine sediment metagenome]|uniref:Uncharacterized protein n=1 Tax=marine sediment metagenome TaxID=412755 RepID=A0A0F9VGZ9_9ZZZZ